MKRFSRVFSFILLAFMIGSFEVSGQKVKVVSKEKYIASCLYNFSWYVNWPSEKKNDSFKFAVVGDKTVYEVLKDLTANKKSGLQDIQVNYFNDIDEVNTFSHIVYLSEWHSKKFDQSASFNSNEHSLVVSNISDGLSKGAAINFIVVDGYMKYEMKKENATTRGLQINSRLETMAHASY
jgi:hypothetical protein